MTEAAPFLPGLSPVAGKPLTAQRDAGNLTSAGVAQPGACHLFRHACATHMLDNGADIRFIQAMLGHAKLETTAIYTHVAILKLKAIHEATHPARLHRQPATAGESRAPDDDAQRRALLDALDCEAEAERDDDP